MKIWIWFTFFLLSSFFFFLLSFIRHNSKTIRCVKILNIPNDCSANGDYSYMFLSCVRATTGELWPKNCLQHISRSPSYIRFLAFHATIVWAYAWHAWSGHTWTTERVRYMQARLQAATSLL